MSAQRPFFTFDPATVVSLFIVLLMGRMAYMHWIVVHQVNMAELDQAWQSVLDRTPHWRAYQNRLLGPMLLHALGWVSGQPLVLLVKAAMLGLNVALFLMVRQATGCHLKGLFTVGVAMVLWTAQTHYWSYPWDFIEAAWLLALIHMAVRGWSRGWFLALFVVALLNRESAVFIGVYMLAHGVMLRKAEALQGASSSDDAKKWMVWGVAMIAVTLVWTEGLRHALFDYSSLAGVNEDGQHAVFGNHRNHFANWEVIEEALQKAQPLFFMLVLHLLALAVVIAGAWRRRSPVSVGLGATMVAYFLILIEFGYLSETRLYQPLVWCLPMLLVLTWSNASDPSNAPISSTQAG